MIAIETEQEQLRFGLTAACIADIQQVLGRSPRLEKAVLFGSRAMATYKNGSDIDLALQGEKLLYDDIIALYGQLDELPYAYTYDLIDYNKISNPAVKAHIDDLGIIFYEKEQSLLPNGWKEYRLGEIARIFDCPHSTPNWTDTGYFVIRSWNVRGGRLVLDKVSFTDKETYISRISRSKPESGDLILTREAPMGEVCLVPDGLDCCLGQRVVLIKADRKKIDPKFLLYSFLTPSVNNQILVNEGTGSTVSNLRIPLIHQLQLILPPLETQIEIASILSALDDKIELNRQMNQTLEAIAQTLFTEWFVRFNFPGFDGELVDGLPKGWRIVTLGEVIQLSYGKALKADSRGDGIFPVVGSSGIVGFHNSFLVQGPGIVIGRKGTIGEVIWIDESFFPIDTTFFVENLIDTDGLYFAYYLLKQQNFKHIASDSAVPGLNRNEALRNKVIIPTNQLVESFNQLVEPIFDKKRRLKIENQTLTQIRDSLLPKLTSGQIQVGTDA